VAGARATVNCMKISCCPGHQYSREWKRSKKCFEAAQKNNHAKAG